MKIIRWILQDVAGMLSFPKIASIFLLFGMLAVSMVVNLLSVSNQTGMGVHGADALLLVFSGPGWEYSLRDFLQWFLPQTLLAYLVGDALNRELKGRCLYTIPRIGSLDSWLLSKGAALWLFTGAYFLVGFVIVGILAGGVMGGLERTGELFVNLTGQPIHSQSLRTLFFHLFFLVWITAFVVTLMQFLMTLLTGRASVGFVWTVILHMVSVNSGYLWPALGPWLPINQGILMRHAVLDPTSTLSFGWTYPYLLIALLVITVTTFFVNRKRELASYVHHF
jgi:hypothetical protein